jgi:hypothetical protein
VVAAAGATGTVGTAGTMLATGAGVVVTGRVVTVGNSRTGCKLGGGVNSAIGLVGSAGTGAKVMGAMGGGNGASVIDPVGVPVVGDTTGMDDVGMVGMGTGAIMGGTVCKSSDSADTSKIKAGSTLLKIAFPCKAT